MRLSGIHALHGTGGPEMSTRKISHIGILVDDAASAARHWSEAFGLRKVEERRIDVEGILSIFLSVGGTWDEMVIEIMEPLDKSDMENALSRRLARIGEGFYHLCLEVDDVEASGEALSERGMRVLMREPIEAAAGPRWLVHPKDAHGVLVEALTRST